MAVNFPNAPTTGQVFTPPGMSAYKWDGEKWSATGATPNFPPGTVMLFWQATAPSGWTKLTTQNDKALRVVSGSGGVAGGTNAFSTVMAQSVVGNSANYHPVTTGSGWGQLGLASNGSTPVPSAAAGVSHSNYSQASNSIVVTSSGTAGAAHNHPITMAIQYIDIILASKD